MCVCYNTVQLHNGENIKSKLFRNLFWKFKENGSIETKNSEDQQKR